MKKYMKSLAVLLCAALLCGAFGAFAEELELELTEDGDEIKLPVVDYELNIVDYTLSIDNLNLNSEDVVTETETTNEVVKNVAGLPVFGNPDEDLYYAYYYDDGDYCYNGREYSFSIVDGVLKNWQMPDESAVDHFDVPDGVIAIGARAFQEQRIKSVTIPNTVTSIGSQAFLGSNIESIVIPGSVKTIDEMAFRECKALKSATIMDGVSSIGTYAFLGSNIESIVIPGSVKTIDEKAFKDCKALKSATIMDGVSSIGRWAFLDCTALENVSLPGSLKTIEYELCYNCRALKRLTIGYGVQEMKNMPFAGCVSLSSVTIPGSIKNIPWYAFYDCTSMEKVVIEEGVESLTYGSFLCGPNLKDITIPASVQEIDRHSVGFYLVTVDNGEEAIHVDDLIIHGKAGSAAEKYADENDFYFDDGTTSISITNGASAELELDSTLQLITEVTPSNPKVKRIWKSSDEKIATVSADGLVTGIAKGKATITVTTKNGKTDSIEINVVAPQPTKIAITNGKTISVDVDSKKQLYTELTPANAETTLTWTSSDKKIATVDAKGMVKGVKKGSATIKVTTKNGKTASIKVKVVAPVPTKVIINQGKSATLYMGNTLKLTTKFAPAKAESKLTWSSSKPAVATVSSKGVVTPKKAGKTKITVKTANGKKASITVKVVDVQSVKLKEGKSKTLKVGKKLALHATVSPKQVKTRLTWTSSDAKVAAVSDKGVVTAKKAGTAKITVKTANGKSATITITVK